MVSSELDFKETFSQHELTIENINTLKKQIYTTKENYEKLEIKTPYAPRTPEQ